jgi:hydroxymethylbilane synthase
MERIIKVGSRKSPLALGQVEEVFDALKRQGIFLPYEIIGMDTPGDLDKQTPISEIEGSDFFTRELDRALFQKEIDCAVHSAKDLPEPLPAGLGVAVMTASIDPSDALVSHGGKKLSELPSGARVGVSSRRRKDQILAARPDLRIVDVRGTIGERLRKFDDGWFEALVIASAALIRLGLEGLISEKLDPGSFAPHPLQGRIAVTVRSDDHKMKELFSKLDREFIHD